ncbi:hypothetical protein E5289_02975 [Lactiplantibacillus pentosus]
MRVSWLATPCEPRLLIAFSIRATPPFCIKTRIIVSPPNQSPNADKTRFLTQSPKIHKNLVDLTRAISERDQ